MTQNNSFLINATTYLEKITQQKYISKAEILALKKMMRKLAETDESYKKLSNRITTISNRAIGKNEANILTEFYKKFQAEITKHKKTVPLPEKVWTTEEYKGIPQGSCIHIEDQTDLEYQGTWSCMGRTRPINVPKKICSETSAFAQLTKAVSAYRISQETTGDSQ